MPTIVAIDCSLSMSRILTTNVGDDSDVKISQKQLANQACVEIFDYLSSKIKLEYSALLSFSSTCQLLCDFTRDYTSLKTALNKVKLRDKACLEPLFQEINRLASAEFGYMVPCNIVIVTDGRLNWSATARNGDQKFDQDFPIKFKSSIHFLCVTEDITRTGREGLIKSIIQANEGNGTINTMGRSSNNCQQAVVNLVKEFTSKNMNVFTGKLHCGKLKNEIVLFPCPEKQSLPSDSSSSQMRSIKNELQIVGFLNISDLRSPPAFSRHLVLPMGNNQILTEVDDTTGDLSTCPSFVVALHGSLKIEHKVALVCVGEDWYGIMSSWTDHKKKSNLVLSLFEIGADCVPWLGSFNNLGPLDGAPPPPQTDSKKHSANFIPATDQKSYAQNLVVWTRPTGLQTDVQKLLRSAKKLPEKTPAFYKDLNRLRKAALAFGFHELLEGVASILERECTMLPGTSHPEAALQLSHAVQELRNLKGYDATISSLKTDFKYHAR